MSTNITTGKWIVKGPTGSERVFRIAVEGRDFKGSKCDFLVAKGISNETNAELIANAPEMLKMLVVVKGVIESQICEREMKNVEQFCIEDLENIRNLIARAKHGFHQEEMRND